MKQASMGVVIIAVCLSVGLAVGFYLPRIVGGDRYGTQLLGAHPQHSYLVDNTEIILTAYDEKLEPQLVESESLNWGEGLAVATFKKGEAYPHSIWLWKHRGDTLFTMVIWGPDESGHKYSVQLGRHHRTPFKLKLFDDTILDRPSLTWNTSPPYIANEGLYTFDVTLE